MSRLLSGCLVAIAVGLVWVLPGTAGAAVQPAFTPVPGSPFTESGVGAVAFSPSGHLLATGNGLNLRTSVFSVSASGSVSLAPGSPLSAGTSGAPIFSPDGRFLATANNGQGSVSVYSVNGTTGALTAVTGSPFASGGGPDDESAAFSPDGGLLAVANYPGSVSVFFVDSSTGALMPVSGSPFSTDECCGAGVFSVAFSPDGSLLATANANTDDVSVLSVNKATGALTPVTDSPFGTGSEPWSVAFSPTGGLLATGNVGDGTVSMFSVDNSTGDLTEVSGSPFATGSQPFSVAFSPTGGLLATANGFDGTVSVFAVDNSTGALTALPGSPFATGNHPGSVAFARGGDLLATGNANPSGNVNAGTLALFTAVSPVIGAPAPGGVYAVGQSVASSFACSDPFGSGITSCTDSNGASGPTGHLDTTTLGPHTYAVTAVSNDGQTASASVNYTVAGAPSATISSPPSGGTYTQGETVATSFSCAEGTDGPGLKSCADSNGASSLTGHLDTTTLGQHLYTVTATSTDGQSSSASVSYLVIPSPTIPSATIKRFLLQEIIPSGKRARLGALLKKHGYVITLTAPSQGALVISWYYLPAGAHLAKAKHKQAPKPVLVAMGSAEFSQGQMVQTIKIKLTRAGTQLLKHSNGLRLTAQGAFTPTSQSTILARRIFKLRR